MLPFLPDDTFDWGGVRVQEQVLYIIGVTFVVTFLLWAFVSYTRIGLAITASAQNERAVQTMGWSPNKLAAITWGVGAALAGLAGVLLAAAHQPLDDHVHADRHRDRDGGGAPRRVPVVPAHARRRLSSAFGEALVTRHRFDIQDFIGVGDIPGIERAVPFLLILLVLVVHGRGLPLRSHIGERLPKLGTGRINVPGLLIGYRRAAFLIVGVMDDQWAVATYISITGAIVVLSIVVLTGYAGQLSLGQWALAGCGCAHRRLVHPAARLSRGARHTARRAAHRAGRLAVRAPALRTRGVNLAIVTLGLGFTIQAVVFTKGGWIGEGFDGGTRIGKVELFGEPVDAATHPQRWALVCLGGFVSRRLVVANLRRSRTGRRLIAVRTNERAAASLGISVFGVKLYAFSVAAAIAGWRGSSTASRGRSSLTSSSARCSRSSASAGR